MRHQACSAADRHTLPVLCLLFGTAILFALEGCDRRTRTGERMTASEALSRSEEVCRWLIRPGTPLEMVSEPARLCSPDGPTRHCWQVIVSSDQHRYLAHLLWDASSSELCLVGCRCGQPELAGNTAPSRDLWSHLPTREVLRWSHHWLRVLRPGVRVQQWAIVGEPRRVRHLWQVKLHGPGVRAAIYLADPSGALLLARFTECSHPVHHPSGAGGASPSRSPACPVVPVERQV